MELRITFPGKKKVEAQFDGFKVLTDQPVANGGEGSAPAPFDLFLASLGTCAGYFVKAFCDERGISTDGLELIQTACWDEQDRLDEIRLQIRLPKDFPERYRSAVTSCANLCSVKKAIQNPPRMLIEVFPSTPKKD